MDRESNDWDIHMGFIHRSVYDFSPACIVLHSFQGIYQHRPPLRIPWLHDNAIRRLWGIGSGSMYILGVSSS